MKVTLPRLVLAAWLAWLVLIGITVWLSLTGAFHPSFLWMAIPLAVQLICTLVLLLGGLWRMLRGPRRLRALSWVMLGLVPTLWTAAYIEYGFRYSARRNHPPNFLVEGGKALTSLVAEPYVRVCYPHRYEGQRFIMWSDSPEVDPKAMDAMDRHILALEESLGGRMEQKVYWVRGPVLGLYGRYGEGWALGTPSNAYPDGSDGLESTDRHEVAHFALYQFLPVNEDVPKLLHEGWAQCHTGRQAQGDWRRCWSKQRAGTLLSLRELTGPEWYYNSNGPVYHQGHLLVDYLLRRFGHNKFVELCRTCREATFDADLRRVYGLGLDELDKAYQKDLAQYDSPDHHFLMSLERADTVDPDRWKQFTEAYCEGTMRLRTAFRQASIEMLRVSEKITKKGSEPFSRERYEFHNNNRRRVTIVTEEESNYRHVGCITPTIGFGASKKGDQPWRIQRRPKSPVHDFATAVTLGQVDQRYLDLPLALLRVEKEWELQPRITVIGPSETDERLVRVSYKTIYETEDKTYTEQGWWDFDPAKDYGLVAARFDYYDGRQKPSSSQRFTVEYETIDGHHVPKLARWEWLGPNGRVRNRQTDTIVSCRFTPPAAEVFEPDTYGGLPADSTDAPMQPSRINKQTSNVGPLTWIAAGLTSLALLLALRLVLDSHRTKIHNPSPDWT